ncbi:MAG TPA: nucleotidyltransferase family protein [Rhodanobacteraceae bacterium]
MRALIFAAGRGERMRPLTDTTPKPLLKVRGKPLIVHHLERLAAIGVHYVVINTSYLAEQFPAILGDGSNWGLRIRYAYEGENPLETGGGMLNALPLLTDEPFITINGDVYSDCDLATLPGEPRGLAHLVMVDNPAQHPDGDFGLGENGQITLDARTPRLTFAGIGVYRPELLDNWRDVIGDTDGAATKPPRFRLAPVLRAAIAAEQITGTHFKGTWSDVGTPERLAALSQP